MLATILARLIFVGIKMLISAREKRGISQTFTGIIKGKSGIQLRIPDFLIWRSRRDLNPRYPFGVHTISSRARYDHFDTAPCGRRSCRLRYITLSGKKSQALFFLFSKYFPIPVFTGMGQIYRIYSEIQSYQWT